MTEADLQKIESHVWNVNDEADDAIIAALIAEVRRLRAAVVVLSGTEYDKDAGAAFVQPFCFSRRDVST